MEDLKKLAHAIRQKNHAETEITRIISKPSGRHFPAEYVGGQIFGISLPESSSFDAPDGHFTGGNLDRKSVNIRWHYAPGGILELAPGKNLPDYYLLMTGPKSSALLDPGMAKPWLISCVFLFDAVKLIRELKHRRITTLTEVPNDLWELAEIYPEARNNLLPLSEKQKNMLALFN